MNLFSLSFIRIVLVIVFWSNLPVFGSSLGSGHLVYDGNSELKKRKQIESSLVLLENKNNLIPLDRLDTLKIAALSVGSVIPAEFQQMLANYTQVKFFNLPEKFTIKDLDGIRMKLNNFNLIIAGIHNAENSAEFATLIAFLEQKTSVVTWFYKPEILESHQESGKPAVQILAFENDSLTQSLAAQLIFGGIGVSGKLPERIGVAYPKGAGIAIDKPVRLKYTLPEEVGISSVKLNASIDSIVINALEKKAFPGCNVFVAKEGKVIFRKAYGFHTFENLRPSRLDDLYDLASVTKISGGLPGILKLVDEGKISLDKPVSDYFPDWKARLFHKSNKADISVRELYAHQSGLVPFIGFWKKTMKNGRLLTEWYSIQPDEIHSFCVAPGIYLDKRFKKSVYKDIRKSSLKTRGKYMYSDLPLVITPEIVENISGTDFLQYLDANFYRPLGATTTTYLPLRKFSRDRVAPTEKDDYYRFQQLQGTVHDESAAVLGGISGNAGLFTSANDLAKLMQMYLQMGSYGGKKYVSETTLKEFTRVQFPQNNNRRGVIFDKPALNNQTLKPSEAYPCKEVSAESFGHFGYTGTFVWMDPKTQLLFIFLSNRVCPTRNNNLISDLNVRTEILSAICKQLKD